MSCVNSGLFCREPKLAAIDIFFTPSGTQLRKYIPSVVFQIWSLPTTKASAWRIGPEAVKSIFFLGAIKIILTEILKTALGDMSAEFAVGKGVEE